MSEIKIQSKLPEVGTSIFTIISAMAEKYDAINLAQGFPNYECDPLVLEKISSSLYEGRNQYAPMAGLLALREEIAHKYYLTQNVSIDPISEITVTAGATQALFTAITTFVSRGDEVIIIEPAYDSYAPSVLAMGGKVVYLTTMPPSFDLDWNELKYLINDRTKMIIINNPGNPSTKVWSQEDYAKLSSILEGTNIIVLSDEVYEHMVYDDRNHVSIMAIESLRHKSISVFSFGKTLHSTGWKVGYCIASSKLMSEFRKVHQFNVFCVNSFVQHGLAEYLKVSNSWQELPVFFHKKRQLLMNEMVNTEYLPLLPQGSYFCLYDYSNKSELYDQDFVEEVIKEYGVAVIPLSAFYHKPANDMRWIRICFAKKDETLIEGAKRLKAVKS